MSGMFRIGLIVVLAMLAPLAGAGGVAPRSTPAARAAVSGPEAVWMCHPGGRCLHMLVHQP
jgi:hypothetical protein